MRSPLPVLLAILSVLGPAAASADGRTCATDPPSPLESEEALRRTTDALGRYLDVCPPGGTIRVAFHVIHSAILGQLSMEAVQAQIQVLNQDYAPSGFQFVLGSVDYTLNAAWFNLTTRSNETAMENALAVDPAHNLNLYTCMPYGALGLSYFPWRFPEDSPLHAVLVDYRSLPGGSLPAYDLGRTATHEIGHYLGLYHTFQRGCTPPGDEISDTPYEAGPNYGCPIGADTCPDVGLDPIHDYMDYTDDACYTEFTIEQWSRMCAMVAAYRPSLIQGGATPTVRGTWGRLKVRYR